MFQNGGHVLFEAGNFSLDFFFGQLRSGLEHFLHIFGLFFQKHCKTQRPNLSINQKMSINQTCRSKSKDLAQNCQQCPYKRVLYNSLIRCNFLSLSVIKYSGGFKSAKKNVFCAFFLFKNLPALQKNWPKHGLHSALGDLGKSIWWSTEKILDPPLTIYMILPQNHKIVNMIIINMLFSNYQVKTPQLW